MAGVLIPVIVHLWNDRRGKVLRIGSVALMVGASRRAAWSTRLTQVLLLVVRCLLVMALAGLLGAPVWVRPAATDGVGWVLIVGSESTAGGEGWRRVADSLVKAGWERHVMDSAGNYWDAFRRMDGVAPVGAAFFVFTPGFAARFAGERPVTRREVHWRVYTPDDSVRRWVEAVWRVSADSIVVVRGRSQPTGTEFQRERLVFTGGTFEGVVVDTSSMRVDVGANEYLRAAVKALGVYTGRRIRSGDGHVIRWRPEWEAAAWDGRLPAMLGEELFAFRESGNDRRVLDPAQVQPARVAAAGGGGSEERVDLRPMVWGLVFVLFLIERIMVYRHDKA